MRIALGCDHRGFKLKEKIKHYLEEKGYKCVDFGTHSVARVDYPDFAALVAKSILRGECNVGILICGTGIGMCIVANKFPGIRAALCYDVRSARLSKSHVDANVLVLPALNAKTALRMVLTWLKTKFEGGRHLRRVKKIRQIEAKVLRKF